MSVKRLIYLSENKKLNQLVFCIFSSQSLDGVAGFGVYVFGPFFPFSCMAKTIGNSMDKFVDNGVAE